MTKIRRSRSRSVSKSNNLKKLLIYCIASCVLLAFLGGIGAYFYAKYYLQSDSFRVTLEQMAVDDMNVSRAKISPLVIDGKWISCPTVSMSGSEFLRKLEITSLGVDVSRADLFHRKLNVEQVNIAQADMTLDIGKVLFSEKKSDKPETWLEKNVLPLHFYLQRGSINELSIQLNQNGIKIVSLNDTRLSLDYDSSGECYLLDIEGGKLALPWEFCSDLNLVKANISYHYASQRWIIPSCRFMVKKGGYIDLKGDYIGSLGSYSSNIVIHDIESEHLVPDKWKGRFQGRINGSVDVKKSGNSQQAQVSGLLEVHDCLLTNISLLDLLAKYCKSDKFKTVKLNQAKCQFTYRNNVLNISNIVLESAQLIRLEGDIKLADDGDVAGLIRIGLRPDGAWSKLPGFSSVFNSENNDGKNGLVWANVNLGGTLDDVTEDLSARLIKAAGVKILTSGLEAILTTDLPVDTSSVPQDTIGNMLDKLINGGGSSDTKQKEKPSSKESLLPIPSSVPQVGGDVINEGLKLLNL